MSNLLLVSTLVLLQCSISYSQTVARDAQINTGEYFIGNDPGIGNGTSIPINNSSTTITAALYNVAIQNNAVLFVRFKNANGIWSVPRSIEFIGTGVGRESLLSYAEYFVGSEPGRGAGNSISIPQARSVSLNILSLSLQRGARIYLRVKDGDNRWSIPVSLSYPTRYIRRAEVIVGSNPWSTPNGSATPLTASDGAFNSAIEQLNGALSNWNRRDTIWVRAQSSDYLWSQPVGDIVLFNAATSYNTRAISFGVVEIGRSKDTTITITNTGRDTLRVSGVMSTNSAFSASPLTFIVPPSQSSTDTLRFSPSSAGSTSGSIVISSNAVSVSDTISLSGNGTLTEAGNSDDHLPKRIELDQNFPNPFNPTTIIRFGVPHRTYVLLTIYNTLGQRIAELVNGEMEGGFHKVSFDGTRLSSGVYLYRLEADGYMVVRELCLLR